MADVRDKISNFKEGPGHLKFTQYNSNETLMTDSVIVGYAKEGIEFSSKQGFRKRTADTARLPLEKVMEGQEIIITAVVQDVSPAFINNFIGADLIEDGTDPDKKRLSITTSTPFKMEGSAKVEIIFDDDTDHAIVVNRMEVTIESLDLSFSTKKDMTFTVTCEGVMPFSGDEVMSYGSVSANG